MKNLSLLAAAAVVLIANTFALTHAANNRSGKPEAEIELTERELALASTPGDTDSSVTLSLRFTTVANGDPPWLDPQKLQLLGFDCTVSATDPAASEFYRRQIPRTAFVALEYVSGSPVPEHQFSVIDAAGDPARLRSLHPNRNKVIILPAVVHIYWSSAFPARDRYPGRPALISGNIQIPTAIHVPKPFSEGFRGGSANSPKSYRVRLNYGRSLEPWVTSIEFN
jgi:hypothetical protein